MKKLFDKEAAKRFWENIKKMFVPKPRNEGAAGKYLKCVDENSTEWADFPSFLNYKGTTQTETTLRAKTNAVKGDVYTVEDTGAEWFYDGENWEYIGELIGGNFVKRTGDSMSGMLDVYFTNSEKGTENRVSIQGNSIDVYHDGNSNSAAKIKRDLFTLTDSDGNIIFKVKMTGGKDIQIGKGAGNNQIVVGSKLSVSTPEAGAFAFGDTNTIGRNGEHSGVFGGNNNIDEKNSLCGGDHNSVSYPIGEGDGSNIVVGSQNSVQSARSAVFGSAHIVKRLEESERTYNEEVYGDDGAGGVSFSKGSLVAGYNHRVHGNNSFASGSGNLVIGRNSHAEGYLNKVYGASAHVEGDSNIAVNNNTHAEGDTTQAIGEGSHSEGRETIASGEFSHAQGDGCEAKGDSSFAGGVSSVAEADYSTAVGKVVKTNAEGALACGQYNNTVNSPLFSVGNGLLYNENNLFEVGENLGTIISTDKTSITGKLAATSATFTGNVSAKKITGTVIDKQTLTEDSNSIEEGGYYRCNVSSATNVTLPNISNKNYSKTTILLVNKARATSEVTFVNTKGEQLGDSAKVTIPKSSLIQYSVVRVTAENILGEYKFNFENFTATAPQQGTGQ